MVKNTQGGSKHKHMARKHINAPKTNKLRVSEDIGEIYAIVTKMLGNGMFHCHCIDDVPRLGHIRGKFSGRGKRDNKVEDGKWVLIGLREWDISSEKSSLLTKTNVKIQKCDLLEVYSDSDKHRLKETISEKWSILDTNDVSKKIMGEYEEDNNVVFGNDRDFDRERLLEEMASSKLEKISLSIKDDDETDSCKEEEVNVDEI